jgi:hypothetical protein
MKSLNFGSDSKIENPIYPRHPRLKNAQNPLASRP